MILSTLYPLASINPKLLIRYFSILQSCRFYQYQQKSHFSSILTPTQKIAQPSYRSSRYTLTSFIIASTISFVSADSLANKEIFSIILNCSSSSFACFPYSIWLFFLPLVLHNPQFIYIPDSFFFLDCFYHPLCSQRVLKTQAMILLE